MSEISSKVIGVLEDKMKMGDCFRHFDSKDDACKECFVSKDCKKHTNSDDAMELQESITNTVTANKATKNSINAHDALAQISERFELINETLGSKKTAIKYDFDCGEKMLSLIVGVDENSVNIKYIIDGDRESAVTINKVRQNDIDELFEKLGV